MRGCRRGPSRAGSACAAPSSRSWAASRCAWRRTSCRPTGCAGSAPDADTDLYLADTLGEMGLFYRLAGIVFVGGSLTPRGGHNPLEPALLDCAILHGPDMSNCL